MRALHPSRRPPSTLTPLRRQRQRTAHYLGVIASLNARIDELENECAQLEAIIASQAQRIVALHQKREAKPDTSFAQTE